METELEKKERAMILAPVSHGSNWFQIAGVDPFDHTLKLKGWTLNTSFIPAWTERETDFPLLLILFF